MKLHRFLVSDPHLEQVLWLHDPQLIKQFIKVLRFEPEQEIVLFNGEHQEAIYRIEEISNQGIKLHKITNMQPKSPTKNVYLIWSLLKKDKNEWVIQKATEVGVNHLWPILSDRSEKKNLNIDRAKKIIKEASEQCGRSNLPSIRQPINLQTAINELRPKVEILIAEQGSGEAKIPSSAKDLAVLVGPEGGWSVQEKELFASLELKHLSLSEFTLRAETAAVVASAKVLF